MRCFVSADIPGEVKAYLASLQERFGCASGVNLVPIENMHVTLAFLGEIDEAGLKNVVEKTADLAGSTNPFTCSIGKLEMIPHRSPRLIWVSVDDGGRLSGMHEALKKSLGFDDLQFSSHITLARMKNRESAISLAKKLGGLDVRRINFMIGSVSVMQSTLAPQGAVYSAVRTMKLRPA